MRIYSPGVIQEVQAKIQTVQKLDTMDVFKDRANQILQDIQ